jgi:hypothetical protein
MAPVRFTFTLTPHQGRLKIVAGAHDAIRIDGTLAGMGSVDRVLPSGGHHVVVSAEGRKTRELEVTIQDDQTATRRLELEAEKPRVPTWAWITGTTLFVGAAATGGYFLLRSHDPTYTAPSGGAGSMSSPLTWGTR